MDFSNIEKKLNQIMNKDLIDPKICKIDDEYLLDLDFYHERKWIFRHIIEYDPFDISNISKALHSLDIQEVQIYVSKEQNFMYLKTIEVKYKDFVDIFYNISDSRINDSANMDYLTYGSALIVTDEKLNFIIKIDRFREHYDLYASKYFVNDIFRYPLEACRDYMEPWYEIYRYQPCKIKYLKYLLEKYF